MKKLSHVFFYISVILCLSFLFSGTSCNSYFESKQKPDNKGLSKEEQDLLSTYKSSSDGNNVNKSKNIGDVENDLKILFNIVQENIPRNAKVQQEEGAHGKISRIEVEIPTPYPEIMMAEVNIIPRGTVDYAKYPVRIDGKIFRDGKVIDEFKTAIIDGVKENAVSNPVETMFQRKFVIKLWDTQPTESFSTLLYVQAKLQLYPPLTEPGKIFADDGTVKPLEETEILGNPLRVTLLKEGM
ncbi:MAG TPA: hypothetical protein PLX23_03830 [Candidatus Hydrogenedens sp.]|nr:hypothetical protein [Candidatus Hydrogenedens sp.]